MEFIGYQIRVEVLPVPRSASFSATYTIYRSAGSSQVSSGTVIGLKTVADAEREGYSVARRWIEQQN